MNADDDAIRAGMLPWHDYETRTEYGENVAYDVQHHDKTKCRRCVAETAVEGLRVALQARTDEADRAWTVLDWLAENNPGALELSPYKASRGASRV